jgi:ABC-type Mn2+/Zn2+ transport system permease subunit
MLAVLHSLAQPWEEQFMQRALLEVALIAVAAGALGCWVVLYETAYAAESLAHALFPGLVLAALAGVPLLVGGVPGIALAGVGIALAGRIQGIERDTAVAVVVTGLFGFGALLALSPASPPGIQGLLFGDVLGVSNSDLILAGALSVAIVGALAVLHPRLLAVGFDPPAARSLGVPALAVEIALMVLLAGAVLVAVQGLGNLLVVAVLVGPAATARLLTERLGTMMALSFTLAVAAGLAGLYLSYYAKTAAGASIAASVVAIYLIAYGYAAVHDRGGRG